MAGEVSRSDKKSRPIFRSSGFQPSTDTPRGAAPEGAERARLNQCTTARRESQARRANFPPAAGQVRSPSCEAARASRRADLTRCGQWEGWREGAHSSCRKPGLQFSDCEPRPDQRTGGARSARGEPREGCEKRSTLVGGRSPTQMGSALPEAPSGGVGAGGRGGRTPDTHSGNGTRSHGRHATASGRSTRAAKKPLPPRKREYGGSGRSDATRSRASRQEHEVPWRRCAGQAEPPTKDGHTKHAPDESKGDQRKPTATGGQVQRCPDGSE
jgi:hypothetical protein